MDCSFAFVEYERRGDADEAYYDMHNRRIGRDDILKIEVEPSEYSCKLLAKDTLVGSHSSFSILAF